MEKEARILNKIRGLVMSCETHQFYSFIYKVQLEKDGYNVTTSNSLLE